MGLKTRVFSLIAVLTLASLCAGCGGLPKSKEATAGDAGTSREQAILVVQKISDSANVEEIVSYPDLDREINGVLYYYVRAVYENGMAAAYFVDAKLGQVFVAVQGEIDPAHPLATAAADQGEPAALTGQAPDASKTATAIETEDAAFLELSQAIGMDQAQIREKFGIDYKDFSVNYDGLMKADYYMEKGFIAAYGKDDKVRYLYCTDQIAVNGAKAGMKFKEIQGLLGSAPVRQTWADTPENLQYELRYSLGTVPLVFFSRQADGGSSILRIG